MPACSDVAARPIHAIGDEVSPGAFVAADLVVQGSARLTSYVWAAEDGATEATGVWDTERNEECAPGGAASDLRCHPAQLARWDFNAFADDRCSTRAVSSDGGGRPCAPPTAMPALSRDPSSSGLLAIDAPVATPFVSDGEGGCAPAKPSANAHYLEGPPIPLTALAPITIQSHGAGRVVARAAADLQGQPLTVATTLRETQESDDCEPKRFPDGYRCVRGNPAVAGLHFRDADCTQPVVVSDAAERGKPPYAVRVHQPSDRCDDVELDLALAVGAKVAVPEPYALRFDGHCAPMIGLPDPIFFEVGEAIELPRIEPR